MKSDMNDNPNRLETGCNVNSTFNFTVGGIAIAVAVLIGYLAYVYWWR